MLLDASFKLGFGWSTIKKLLNSLTKCSQVFFNNYTDCTGPQASCQINIVDIEDFGTSSGVEIYNLNTRGVLDMVTLGGSDGIVAATQADNLGSWGGVLAAYLGFE